MELLKIIDNFLKFLKTDRNTFATYILALISVYIVVDRLIEVLFIIFTGVSFSFACVAFAFFFSGNSKFAKADVDKLRIFNVFCISLYIVGISALVQWLNQAIWLGLLSLPNYTQLATEFYYLFQPAFTAIGLYIPLVTFYKLFKWLFFSVNDSKDIRDSIFEYGGISLSTTKDPHGIYSCEVKICTNPESGKDVIIPEVRRFDSLLAVGVSGSRKNNLNI